MGSNIDNSDKKLPLEMGAKQAAFIFWQRAVNFVQVATFSASLVVTYLSIRFFFLQGQNWNAFIDVILTFWPLFIFCPIAFLLPYELIQTIDNEHKVRVSIKAGLYTYTLDDGSERLEFDGLRRLQGALIELLRLMSAFLRLFGRNKPQASKVAK